MHPRSRREGHSYDPVVELAVVEGHRLLRVLRLEEIHKCDAIEDLAGLHLASVVLERLRDVLRAEVWRDVCDANAPLGPLGRPGTATSATAAGLAIAARHALQGSAHRLLRRRRRSARRRGPPTAAVASAAASATALAGGRAALARQIRGANAITVPGGGGGPPARLALASAARGPHSGLSVPTITAAGRVTLLATARVLPRSGPLGMPLPLPLPCRGATTTGASRRGRCLSRRDSRGRLCACHASRHCRRRAARRWGQRSGC
mmetsp:Transcript_131874/g.367646  ORF Transcript_131874/g.367646 Transcript_131874/m.367646 type:complete len:263 (+) Transcript_131874:114-902(+)